MQNKLGAAVFLFAAASAVFGQAGAGQGSISGEVRDPSGSAVPNATITVSNETNGVRRSLASNSAGVFSVPALPPTGGYEISVMAPGFAEYTRKDVTLQVGQNLDLTVNLTVAAAATQVDVTAELTPVADGAKTEVSQVIGAQEIMELPINGRRFDSFALLTPGVVQDGTFGLISFRGVALGNSYLTDGNDTTNQYYQEAPGRTRINASISQDAVQEFQVITAGFLPEYGRSSGGVVNTITRSGSNAFHGTGFWFFRNRSLNARDRYAAFNPAEYRHQSGGSIGGPIKKDKLFFFANTEIVRRRNPIASSIVGPAAINQATRGFVRTGTTGCVPGPNGPTIAQCDAADAVVARHFGSVPRRADSELFFAKIDWRPSERHSFSFSGNYLRFISPNGIQTGASLTNGGALGNNADSTVRDRWTKLGYTAVVSPTILNEFRFGWFKDRQFDSPNAALAPPFGNVTLSVAGINNLGAGAAYPRLLPSEQRFQIADNLSWTKGRHTTKFGFDMANTQEYTDTMFNRFGSYTYASASNFAMDFIGNTTGAKRWQTYTQTFGNAVADFTIRDWSFFGQDQFRVTNNFTLSYGLRYDRSQLPQPKIINPDYPQTGRIPTFNGQLGPRIGFAYSFNNARTVFRVGYGMFHQRYGGGILNSMFTQNGVYQKNTTYTGSVPADLAVGPVFPNNLPATDRPASGTVNVTFAAPDFRPNYTQNGDVSIEHQVGRNSTLTVSYLYNRGFHIIGTRDLNIGPLLPTPVTYRINDASGNQVGTYTTPVYSTNNRVDRRYSRVLQIEHGGKSWYDGLAVSFRGRWTRDLFYNVSYTWSHAIDLGQGQGDDNINRFANNTSLNNLFNGDYRLDKAEGQLDQRHRFVFTWIASHNFTKRNDAFSRYVINNWQISGVTTLSSGRPTFANIFINTHVTGLVFPFFTLNGFGGDTRVPFWPTNAARLDGVYRLDARLTKNLPISERYKLAINFEASNVTNSPYDTNINHQAYTATNGVLAPSAGYGQGTQSAAYPDGTNVRRAQVSLRFTF